MKQDQREWWCVERALVRRLVSTQFPAWADLAIDSVDPQGHDNRTFRLGSELCVRLPSHPAYAPHVLVEHRWLPRLAPRLPLTIPAPVALGMPDRDYPAHWTVNRWLPGKDAAASGVTPTTEMASDLARFLAALESVDAQDAPPPSADNFFRGGSLMAYDAEVHDCLGALADVIDSEPIVNVWERATASKNTRSPVWVHGDIAPSNLLIDDHGRLSAVIDFGQLAAGDPACDLTIAWTFFSGTARRLFREQVGSDAETWVRARGWALWKALSQLRAHLHDDNRVSAEAGQVKAAQVIAAVLDDDR